MRSNAQLRILASELRRLRERAGLSQEQAAQRIEVDRKTLGRVERGLNRPLRRTMSDLLDLYGASDDQRAALTKLWSEAHQDGWVNRVELPGQYGAFVELESQASREWTWDWIVPGLLQTEAYARTLIWSYGRTSVANKEAVLSTRLARQERLRSEELELWAIIGETALTHIMGGTADMRRQAEWLCEASELPNVTIQIMPLTAGAHVGTAGSFIVLDFAPPYPSMVYIEHVCGDLFLGEEAVQDARSQFDMLRASALSQARSVDLIQEIRKAV